MLDGFSWLRKNSSAYCVTLVQGLDETELLRRFGADLSRTLTTPFFLSNIG